MAAEHYTERARLDAAYAMGVRHGRAFEQMEHPRIARPSAWEWAFWLAVSAACGWQWRGIVDAVNALS